jgi:hypothetical protein
MATIYCIQQYACAKIFKARGIFGIAHIATFAFVNFMVTFFNASDVDTLLLIYFTNSFSILHVLTRKIRMTYYKIGKCM